MITRSPWIVALLALATTVPSFAQKTPIRITADLSEAPRKIFHAEVEIPVAAGALTLTSPKWIPGHHMPSGPAGDITGVVFTANGQRLDWKRDDLDLYQFHLTIPKGTTSLHAHLDCIVTSRISQKMAALEWESLLLYPAGLPVRSIAIEPALKVPAGWGVGTALAHAGDDAYPLPAAGATVHYAVTNVEQLLDSPVITGANFHEYALAPDVTPKHYIDVVADQPEDAELRPAFIAELNNLVHEASSLYNSHHYGVYHFLLTMSDVAGGQGLEHGQSSDNGVGEKDYSDAAHQVRESDLLPHEFTHSWNGKYRRPAALYQPDFATPQQGGLLWVYEGMTQYWGNVLAARSGLQSQQAYRDKLAESAANLDSKPGREWRPTADTAVAASILRHGNPAWSNLRRAQDYYQEGELLWLDADTLIRKLTAGKKSLDDFSAIFFGKGGNTGPEIATYNFDELVADLNQVVVYDWATFLHDRVDKINVRADVAGIEQGGYKLVYKDKPNATTRSTGSARRGLDCWYSLGIRFTGEGAIADVRWNGVADKAQLAPGDKVLAVNGEVYSADAMRKALRAAKTSKDALHLIVQADTFVRTVEVDYHDGEHYPVLERADGTAAILDQILAARNTAEKVAEPAKTEE